jgi:hypothetical protein
LTSRHPEVCCDFSSLYCDKTGEDETTQATSVSTPARTALSAPSKDLNIRSPDKIKYRKIIQAKSQHTLAQNIGTVAPKGTRARTTARNISPGLNK